MTRAWTSAVWRAILRHCEQCTACASAPCERGRVLLALWRLALPARDPWGRRMTRGYKHPRTGAIWPPPPPPGEPCYVCGCKVAPDGACAYNSAHMPRPEDVRDWPDADEYPCR